MLENQTEFYKYFYKSFILFINLTVFLFFALPIVQFDCFLFKKVNFSFLRSKKKAFKWKFLINLFHSQSMNKFEINKKSWNSTFMSWFKLFCFFSSKIFFFPHIKRIIIMMTLDCKNIYFDLYVFVCVCVHLLVTSYSFIHTKEKKRLK